MLGKLSNELFFYYNRLQNLKPSLDSNYTLCSGLKQHINAITLQKRLVCRYSQVVERCRIWPARSWSRPAAGWPPCHRNYQHETYQLIICCPTVQYCGSVHRLKAKTVDRNCVVWSKSGLASEEVSSASRVYGRSAGTSPAF